MGDGPLRNYDLSAEGAYVKTIDFDNVNAVGDSYSEGDIWRFVYPGMNTAPGIMPTLLVAGGTNAAATVVYIWSADESVMVPVASGANTISTVTVGGVDRKVLKVAVPAGADSATFSMKGADGAVVGSTTSIYLSLVQGAVYKPTGELADVTVSRTVEVITAPEPTVKIFLDSSSATKMVTATADYITCNTQLAVKMEPACDEDVTVDLNALVSGDSGRISDITGESVMYAPGGGGGCNNRNATEPAAGISGGGGDMYGRGGVGMDAIPTAGEDGKGGGGASCYVDGAKGGDGVVIVRISMVEDPLVSPGLFDVGDTFTRQSEEKAAAFAQEINSDIETYLSVPAGVLNRSAYRSLFRAVADGRIVKFDLTDEAAAAVKRQVDAATLEIPLAAVSAGSDDSVIIQNPTAGLWYSISSGPAMDALVEGARKMATGKTLTLEVPCLGSSGFYKVNANITGKE